MISLPCWPLPPTAVYYCRRCLLLLGLLEAGRGKCGRRSSSHCFVAFHLVGRFVPFALLDVDANAHRLVMQLCAVLQLQNARRVADGGQCRLADLLRLLVRVADVQAIPDLAAFEIAFSTSHVRTNCWPVPALVDLISDSTIWQMYLPAGIGSNEA